MYRATWSTKGYLSYPRKLYGRAMLLSSGKASRISQGTSSRHLCSNNWAELYHTCWAALLWSLDLFKIFCNFSPMAVLPITWRNSFRPQQRYRSMKTSFYFSFLKTRTKWAELKWSPQHATELGYLACKGIPCPTEKAIYIKKVEAVSPFYKWGGKKEVLCVCLYLHDLEWGSINSKWYE